LLAWLRWHVVPHGWWGQNHAPKDPLFWLIVPRAKVAHYLFRCLVSHMPSNKRHVIIVVGPLLGGGGNPRIVWALCVSLFKQHAFNLWKTKRPRPSCNFLSSLVDKWGLQDEDVCQWSQNNPFDPIALKMLKKNKGNSESPHLASGSRNSPKMTTMDILDHLESMSRSNSNQKKMCKVIEHQQPWQNHAQTSKWYSPQPLLVSNKSK